MCVYVYVAYYRTLETSLLECHSGVKHQATANCSKTQYSLLMNGTERELRTVPFSFSNCDNVNKKFLNTCKGTYTHNILILLCRVLPFSMQHGNIV